ncbi:putative (+)-abscisic acid 8'-hydroxylase [Lupinus albus]|uniref:Putative (+)-abscisic acid 8'-hydroxylase n=1 Tax=Lupinus albus TaxID=3870 RepID=A0A6A4NM14_LUPAL|nr:putative (+)-abscisic acid 8'-hydroxylase [Lupinus albus]
MDGIFTYIISSLAMLILFSLMFFLLPKLNRRPQNHTSAKLPPGSMGWPYIGHTFQLYSQDPNVFFSSKHKRYGEIFKINILGCPCVMLTSPEAAKFVLVTQAHLFKPTYPKSKELLIGPCALFFHQGDYHMRLRKLVQRSLSLDALHNLVPDIEALALSSMKSWGHGHVINTFREMKRFSFEVGILYNFGHIEPQLKGELKKNYWIVDTGYNSFPTNIPGTQYKKALLARKRIGKILSEIICERKEKKLVGRDLLSCLLNWKGEKGETLSDDQIADNIIGVLFAAQDTTASVMTWIVKYLHDEPKLLESVKAEQKAIQKSNEGNQPLSWNQTRNMPITYKVVLESLRMASIISFPFREAVADVEYKGNKMWQFLKFPQSNAVPRIKQSNSLLCDFLRFLIPKGWKAMPLFRNIHHNPEFFPDPKKFNPSRFEVAPKPNTFMPFGSGVHSCPGNELAKLETLIMIHHLITKFRWEVVGSQCGIQYGPFPLPFNGLQARYWEESTI